MLNPGWPKSGEREVLLKRICLLYSKMEIQAGSMYLYASFRTFHIGWKFMTQQVQSQKCSLFTFKSVTKLPLYNAHTSTNTTTITTATNLTTVTSVYTTTTFNYKIFLAASSSVFINNTFSTLFTLFHSSLFSIFRSLTGVFTLVI